MKSWQVFKNKRFVRGLIGVQKFDVSVIFQFLNFLLSVIMMQLLKQLDQKIQGDKKGRRRGKIKVDNMQKILRQ
eukprot:8476339-Karenia_brevis.AAC.1